MSDSIVPKNSAALIDACALAEKGLYAEAFNAVTAARTDKAITNDQYIGAQFSLCSIALEAGDDEAAIQALQKSTSQIRPHNLRLRMMIIENALDIAEAAGEKGNVLVTANAAKTAFIVAGYDDPRAEPQSRSRAKTVARQTRALERFDDEVMDYFETAIRAFAETDQNRARGLINDTMARLTAKARPNESFTELVKTIQIDLGL